MQRRPIVLISKSIFYFFLLIYWRRSSWFMVWNNPNFDTLGLCVTPTAHPHEKSHCSSVPSSFNPTFFWLIVLSTAWEGGGCTLTVKAMCHRWAHQGYLLWQFFFPFPFILSQLSVWLSYCTHSWPPSSTVTVHIKYFLIRVWNEANDVLDVPASLLQLTGSSSLGLAWKVETPTIIRRQKCFFPPV